MSLLELHDQTVIKQVELVLFSIGGNYFGIEPKHVGSGFKHTSQIDGQALILIPDLTSQGQYLLYIEIADVQYKIYCDTVPKMVNLPASDIFKLPVLIQTGNRIPGLCAIAITKLFGMVLVLDPALF